MLAPKAVNPVGRDVTKGDRKASTGGKEERRDDALKGRSLG